MLELLLEMIGNGDKLVVWKLDRLARNMRDLCDIVDALEMKGTAFEVLDQRMDKARLAEGHSLEFLESLPSSKLTYAKKDKWQGLPKSKPQGSTLAGNQALTSKKLEDY